MADDEIVILDDDLEGLDDDTPTSQPDKEEEEEFDELDEEALNHEPIEEASDDNETSKSNTPENRTKTLGIIFFATFVLLGIFLTILSMPEEEHLDTASDINETNLAHEIKQTEELSKFEKSKLEELLEKANALYEQGNELEALKVYQDIASFNQAISHYNIGVAQMKEKKYDVALDSFREALKHKDQKCISAINSAVCALHLNNNKLYKYYTYLAGVYLKEETSSPLYSYYYSLIGYLRGNYVESLVSLKNRTSKFYENEQNNMAAKIYTVIGNNNKAIAYLENRNTIYDDLPLGLLYAKVGNYKLARSKLTKSLMNNIEPLKSNLALSLVYNKQGLVLDAAKKLDAVRKEFKEKALNVYPIQTKLKESLFNPQLTQKEFKTKLFMSRENINGLLFYYAPYKVFDARQTIEYIRKGEMNVLIDETGDAQEMLRKSSSISKVNIALSQGIKLAIENQIYRANKKFSQLTDIYPNHSILFYNLALSYAQLGNFSAAYVNFLRSYNLDSSNYLAGIFALISAEAFEKNDIKVLEAIKHGLEEEADDDLTTRLNKTVLAIKENDTLILQQWLETNKSDKPLYVALDAISAYKMKKETLFLEKVQKLQLLFSNDVTTNILYAYAKNMHQPLDMFAKDIQSIFLNKQIDFNALFYGSMLTKSLYTQSMQISGMLHHAKNRLKERLKIELKDPMGVLQALAYLDIYVKDYEESYTLYNELIDKYGFKDSNTLFLGAVAAIGAGHKENAIALLELAKIDNPTNYESKYALGLLYQEVKNFEGAVIQYKKIKAENFRSEYFTFDVVPAEK